MFSLYLILPLLLQSNEDPDIATRRNIFLSQTVRVYQKLLTEIESSIADNTNDLDMIFSSVQTSKSQGSAASSMSWKLHIIFRSNIEST